MRPLKPFILIPLMLSVWFFTNLNLVSAQSFADIKNRVKTHILSNGMKFIVLERHHAPVVSFHVHADVGSANETYGITGISHLLEHMAFKGTKVVGTTDYTAERKVLDAMDAVYSKIRKEESGFNPDAQKLTALNKEFEALRLQAKVFVVTDGFSDMLMQAGDRNVNAGTGTDLTVYINSLPSNKVEFWMALTSDRFLNPVFREFYKERDVVMEERRLATEGQPFGRLMEDLFSVAFKAHSYRHSVVGHMSDLQAITRKDVRDYFRTYYGPGNLTVVMVGDVNAAEVFKMGEIYFGRIPGRPSPEPVRTREPEQWGERHFNVEMPSQPILILGYHRPEVNHKDNFPLAALANILGEGRSSRLYKTMVIKEKAAIEIGTINGFPGEKFPHLLAVYAVPAQGHTSKTCLELIDQAIEKIKADSVTEGELRKFKQISAKNIIDSMKSNSSMAEILAYAEVILGSWRQAFEQVDKIRVVSREDVRRVAQTYFVPRNRTVGEIIPKTK